MIKTIGYSIISILTLFLCWLMLQGIKITPINQPVYIYQYDGFMLLAIIPLSLIVIGTTLMIRAIWKAKWQ